MLEESTVYGQFWAKIEILTQMFREKNLIQSQNSSFGQACKEWG